MTTASGEGDVTCGYAPLGTKPAGSLKAGLPLFAPAFWPVSGKAGQKHQNRENLSCIFPKDVIYYHGDKGRSSAERVGRNSRRTWKIVMNAYKLGGISPWISSRN